MMKKGEMVMVLDSAITGRVKRVTDLFVTLDLVEQPKKKYPKGVFYESRIIRAARCVEIKTHGV